MYPPIRTGDCIRSWHRAAPCSRTVCTGGLLNALRARLGDGRSFGLALPVGGHSISGCTG